MFTDVIFGLPSAETALFHTLTYPGSNKTYYYETTHRPSLSFASLGLDESVQDDDFGVTHQVYI